MLVGNNSLTAILRYLTSAELFLNSDYYYQHPLLLSVYNNNKDLFSCYDTLFSICVSNSALKSNVTKSLLVIEESKKNVKNYVWAPFLCILSLSSVIKRSIITCYPDFGIAKYRVVFNQKVLPRCKDNCFVPFRILFCGLSNVKKIPTFVLVTMFL